ncbi:hypothetical protein [Spirosoma flavum]|uniref:Uncharacterized protein n=1 Tax=Spirosoma flavum TaxID=2048557 RepID=A0ABW6ADD4_9BACT
MVIKDRIKKAAIKHDVTIGDD